MMRLLNSQVPLLHVQTRFKTCTTSLVPKQNVAAAYQPKNIEKLKYDRWEKIKLFTADNFTPKPKFSMVLPPPNVTGNLHLG